MSCPTTGGLFGNDEALAELIYQYAKKYNELHKTNPTDFPYEFPIPKSGSLEDVIEWSYNRNKAQDEAGPVTREQAVANFNEGKWKLADEKDSVLHQQQWYWEINQDNEKYVTPEGYEYIFRPDGTLVIDPFNRGTRNNINDLDFPDKKGDEIGHTIVDVLPWILAGTGPDDPSTKEMRLSLAIDGLGDKLNLPTDLLCNIVQQTSTTEQGLKIRVGPHITIVIKLIGSASTEASPLVLDLDGDGIELVDLLSDSAVFWDGDQDGVAEQSGWVGQDDGLLAMDLNGNGRIDHQSELFGSAEEDGFAILAEHDANGDAVIDANDAAFDNLLVWIDANGDGRSDDGELRTLSELDITSVSAAGEETSSTIAGNRISHQATYTLADGTTRTMVDAWFRTDNVSTMHDPAGDVPLWALMLPEVRGYGRLPWLSQVYDDGAIRDAVLELVKAAPADFLDPDFDFLGKFETLLFNWAGVDEIDPQGRGAYINGRKLAFLEVLTDTPFLQRGDPNPRVEASALLSTAYDTAFNAMLFRFVAQTDYGKPLFNNIGHYDVYSDAFTGTPTLDIDHLSELVGGWTYAGTALATAWATLFRTIEGGIGLDALGVEQIAAVNALIEASDTTGALDFDAIEASIFIDRRLSIYGTTGNETLTGGTGHDFITGSLGNDVLYGLRGHDQMDGGSGDDVLDGGEDDDTYLGQAGNDTYIHTSGIDTIRETGGIDKVLLKNGMAASSLTLGFSPTNADDLNFYRDGQLFLIIENQFVAANFAIETIVFEDGTEIALASLGQAAVGDHTANEMFGVDLAMFPHDKLHGYSGTDTLSGGLGDDQLNGGSDDDVYKVTNGFDTIEDSDGIDQIEFGEAYDQADIDYIVQDRDLVIRFGAAGGVRIIDQFTSGRAIEQFRFSDGTVVDLMTLSHEQSGTAGNDQVRGIAYGGGGDKLNGLGGHDRLYGDKGDDTLNGGAGNDSLYGGEGSDTYVYEAGRDLFSDSAGLDRILFGASVVKSQITLERSRNDLLVSIDGAVAFSVYNQFSEKSQIEQLVFDDGQAIDILSVSFSVPATERNDSLYGISYGGLPHDILNGLGGDDYINGRGGNDTLDGGEGDDWLLGEDGDDLYRTSAGKDVVSEYGGAGNDLLRLWVGVTLAEITFTRQGTYDLAVGNALTGDSVTIGDYFRSADNPFGGFEALTLADGTKIEGLAARQYEMVGTDGSDSLYGVVAGASPNDILKGLGGKDYLYGRDGDDTLDGGAGDDSLQGEDGNDVYLASSGKDVVREYGEAGNDTLRLWAGAALTDIALTRQGTYDLRISNALTGDTVTIEDYFYSADYPFGGFEAITLANGRTIDGLATRQYEMVGTDSGETLYGIVAGGSPDDILNGLGGKDTLYGRDGNDTLDGGDGDDRILGENGNDVYMASAGKDVVSEYGKTGDDTLWLWTGATLADIKFTRQGTYDLAIGNALTSDTITIDDYFYSADYPFGGFEAIKLADGTPIEGLATRQYEMIGTSGSDSLFGIQANASPDDILNGLGGKDSLYGRDGKDTLDGGDGDDRSYGEDGDDLYLASTGKDFVSEYGESGNDTLRLWSGVTLTDITFRRQDTYDLTIGNALTGDTVTIGSFFYSADDPFGSIESITLADGKTIEGLAARQYEMVGTSGSDILYGIAANASPHDIIKGLGGGDSLYGRDGNDTLDGGEGNDRLNGDDGNDTLTGGAGSDTLAGGLGNDVALFSGAQADYSIVRNTDGSLIVTDGRSGPQNEGADRLIAIEQLMFSDGIVDTTDNGPPGDILISNASIAENEIAATSVGTLSAIDPEGDSLLWSLTDESGCFALQTLDGIATIVSTRMLDFESRQSYTVVVSVSDGDVEVSQNFIIAVDDRVDVVVGTAKSDRLIGASGADAITGLGGADRLDGLDGDDVLSGGRGVDKLYGRAGADSFVFLNGDTGRTARKGDTIYDFKTSEGDSIDLTGWDANSRKADIQDFAFIGKSAFTRHAGELRYVKEKSDTWIQGDTNGDGRIDFIIHLDDAVRLRADAFDL